MPIFSQCDLESEVQLNDKTRLNGSKCFVSKGSDEIDSVLISPSLDVDAIECFDEEESERYLDWAYSSFAIDVGSQNSELKYSVSGTEHSINLTAGTYTLSAYIAEVQDKMNDEGPMTVSLVLDQDTFKVAVTSDLALEFLNSPVALQMNLRLGASNLSHVSDVIGYGIRYVTVESSNGAESDSKSFPIKVYSEYGDRLFVSDGDLMAHEPEIMKWVSPGRSSFKDVYRRSQKLIVAWLDEQGYVNAYDKKYTKWDLVDIEEVRQWSTFMSLRLIFDGISNAIDDVFDRKARQYELNEKNARNRVVLRIDTNEDGVIDSSEYQTISSGSLIRR